MTRQARYCYGCYLLARAPRSAFSYAQSFQLTRLPKHRTGGAAMFSYFELPLGNPTGPAVHNSSGGWSRAYDGATGEWLVEGLTGEYHYLQMILTVRSEDPMSAVLVASRPTTT
jgi:hypothetical protein